jgi:hypothetical protein
VSTVNYKLLLVVACHLKEVGDPWLSLSLGVRGVKILYVKYGFLSSPFISYVVIRH